MKVLHLRGRKRCEQIRTKGRNWTGKHMVIRSLPALKTEIRRQEGCLYVGTFAGAKLHASAVVRNRMRRRCKEAVRLAIAPLETANYPATCLLISPRSSSLQCTFDALLCDIKAFLSTLR